MGLYIEDMFSNATGRVPGRLIMHVPNYDTTYSGIVSWTTLYGILTSEYTIGGQNKWGNIIENVAELTDFSSLVGSESMYTWIGSSVQCWKGTDPLNFTLDFIMVNYKPGLNLEDKLKSLLKLTSMNPTEGVVGSQVSVGVHGGYTANVLQTNVGYFTSNLKKSKNELQAMGERSIIQGFERGTVTVELGSRFTIANLLVSRCNFTPSNIEVAAESTTEQSLPLYYNVTVSLTGTHALLSTEVDRMFASPDYDASKYY